MMKRNMSIVSMIVPLLFAISFQAIAQPIPDFQVNENASLDGSEQADPQIDGDGQGNYVVTWQDKRNGIDFNIFAQIFLSDGTTSGVNFRVSNESGHASQYRPDVAVDANLNFVIIWLDKRRGDWEVYGQRFSSDGTALGDHFIANVDQDGTEQEHPSVLMDSDGGFVVVWADERTDDWDVYAQRFANDGTALGGEILVNENGGGTTQYWPWCAGNEAGDFVVTWADERAGNYDIYLQHFLADGTMLGNNVRVNADGGNADQMVSGAAVDVNGNYIVVWSDKRSGYWDIYAQRYSSDGQPLGNNFLVNDDIGNAYHSSPSVSTDQDGNFVVNWTDGRNGNSDIYAQRFSVVDGPIGSNFLVNDVIGDFYQFKSEVLVNDNGSFTIAWDDHRLGNLGDIFAQSYASDGTAVEVNFKVNDDEGSENQSEPVIALDGAGNFIIAWSDQRADIGDIYAQRFSSDGTEQGIDIKVNDDAETYCQWEPSVAADADGNFVVVWTDWRADLWYASDIYAQRFAADGTPLGTNFIASDLGGYIHISPQVIYRSDGGFIVVWGDSYSDSQKKNQPETRGTEPDIYFQQFSSEGTPVGNTIKVNDDVGYTEQTSPSIAIDADDNFTIAWEDTRNVDGDIYYQQFAEDGTPLGINLRVEVSDLGDAQREPSLSMDDTGDFVIAWIDSRGDFYDIYAQRFVNDGSAVGADFRVNSDNGALYHSWPCVSVNSIGNFVITWSEYHDGNNDVYAQRYLRGGMSFGEVYRVSSTEELEQTSPFVVLGDNRIFTTWKDNRGENSGYDIWANVLDWDSGVAGVDLLPGSITSLPILYQNSPNPFNPQTTIDFYLDRQQRVTIALYDLSGRQVAVLTDQLFATGRHQVDWDGKDSAGQAVSSGTYLVRMQTPDVVESRKIMLVR